MLVVSDYTSPQGFRGNGHRHAKTSFPPGYKPMQCVWECVGVGVGVLEGVGAEGVGEVIFMVLSYRQHRFTTYSFEEGCW